MPPFPSVSLFFWISFASSTDAVSVAHRSEGSGTYLFVVSNHRPAPYQLSVWFTEFVNLEANASLPVEVVLPGGMKDYPLFRAKATAALHRFRYKYRYYPGDPRMVLHQDDLLYQFPYPPGVSHFLGQGYRGEFSHQNEYALDFQMPVGTPVCAARKGVVLETKNDGVHGGVDPSLKTEANYVRIYHEDGTFADYVHLKHRGVLVHIGDSVNAGDRLGLSGNTGYSSEPHLHFAVSKPTYFDSETLPVMFLGPEGTTILPREGKTYTAIHRREELTRKN